MADTIDITEEFEQEITYEADYQTSEELEVVSYVVDNRWKAMDDKRAKKESRWQMDERQLQAFVEDSLDGKAVVNMPIEQNQIEMYQGQINPLLNFSIDPEWRADVGQLMMSKAALDHFIKKEKILPQIRVWDYQSAQYGSGILGVTVDQEVKLQWEASDDEFYSEDWKSKKISLWHIGIKNIPIRKVWFDERPTSFDDCMDCIYEEDMGIEEFRLKFLNEDGSDLKPFKHIKAVSTDSSDLNPYGKDKQVGITDRNIRIWHYYNKITGAYYIIADKKRLIYKGKITSKHGQLPFVLRQFYPYPSNIYGISLVQKMESVKPYINNFLKVALDGMRYSVAPVILTGNNTNVDWEMYYDPSTINVWQFTGDIAANNMQQMQFNANLNGIMEIITIMEDFGIQNTGINVKAPYSKPAGTAFEAGLQKEEQNTRMQAIYQIRDEALEHALTMELCNIMQYAPTTLWEFLTGEGGTEDFKPYQIKVTDKKVVKNKSGIQLEEAPGNIDFFDMPTEWLQEAGGLKVRIDTPTNQTVLKSLEKAEFSDMVGNALTLKQAFPDLNIWSGDEWLKRMEIVYGFDTDKLYLKSKDDERTEAIAWIMDMTKELNSMMPAGQTEPTMWAAPLPMEAQNLPTASTPTQDMMATQTPVRPGSLAQLETLSNANPTEAMASMGTK